MKNSVRSDWETGAQWIRNARQLYKTQTQTHTRTHTYVHTYFDREHTRMHRRFSAETKIDNRASGRRLAKNLREVLARSRLKSKAGHIDRPGIPFIYIYIYIYRLRPTTVHTVNTPARGTNWTTVESRVIALRAVFLGEFETYRSWQVRLREKGREREREERSLRRAPSVVPGNFSLVENNKL